jgi:hypothetical protein
LGSVADSRRGIKVTHLSTHSTCDLRFLTAVNTKQEERQARFLIESLRSFGGELRACPVWVFVPGAVDRGDFAAMENVAVFPSDWPVSQLQGNYGYKIQDRTYIASRKSGQVMQ